MDELEEEIEYIIDSGILNEEDEKVGFVKNNNENDDSDKIIKKYIQDIDNICSR